MPRPHGGIGRADPNATQAVVDHENPARKDRPSSPDRLDGPPDRPARLRALWPNEGGNCDCGRRESEVKIPNADKAEIAEDKLCNYLLNPTHRRGASKAKLLISMGYSVADWQRLEADIRAQHLTAEVDRETDTDYGKRFEILAP